MGIELLADRNFPDRSDKKASNYILNKKAMEGVECRRIFDKDHDRNGV